MTTAHFLEIKQWQILKQGTLSTREARKKDIRKLFRSEKGLVVETNQSQPDAPAMTKMQQGHFSEMSGKVLL